VQYPNVKNAHIVPRTYLLNFAVDEKITVHLVKEKRTLARQPIENVATRRHFYRRKRPDGTDIDDIEWSLAQLEGIASPPLHEFDERWPLDEDDKQKLAELFAFQLLRGPRYKSEYGAMTQRFIEDYKGREDLSSVTAEEMAAFDEALIGDSYRLQRMMVMSMTLTSIFVSTHWTLVEFGSPVLATSDHPVVIWKGGGPLKPQAVSVLGTGVLECIEYRLPLSPSRAVLMTWADKADDEDPRVLGRRDHAMNLNAFTIANADRQWFTRPGAKAPRSAGKVDPLSPTLVRGYTAEQATRSERRAQVWAHVQEKTGRDFSDREIMRVKVERRRP
jgi:Protein of unknown function (DUF4238)